MIKVPQLIIDLINDGDGYTSDSYYFDDAVSVDGIRESYYNVEPYKKITQKDLHGWYQTSVKLDNFLGLFDESGNIDTNNFLYKEYLGAISGFPSTQNRPAPEVTTIDEAKWNAFFETKDPSNPGSKNVESSLFPPNTNRNFQTPPSNGADLFKEMANAIHQSFVKNNKYRDYYNMEPNRVTGGPLAADVLKAWSFYLSIRNWKAAQKKVDELVADDELETNLDSEQLILEYLKEREIDGKGADASLEDIIERINEARRALNASSFNKQKYLIENIHDLQGLGQKRNSEKLGVELNRILKFTNSHKNAINKLIGANKGREMFKLSNVVLSKLVPKIKLFKVVYDESMKKKAETPITFPTTFLGATLNPEQVRDPYEFVGSRKGYGIKSFSWEYKGADPFSVDRDITATLELYFQDFAEFTRDRGGFRYVDLIVPLEKDYPQSKAVLGENFSQDLRIEAGWEVPHSLQKELELIKMMPDMGYGSAVAKKMATQNHQAKLASIEASQVNFVLHPVDYNISFEGNANGASTITINYRARIESIGKNRLINVIGATQKEAETVKYYERKIDTAEDDDEKRKFKDLQQNLYKNIKSEASKRFIKKLTTSRSIYWRWVNLEEIMISTFGKSDAKKYFKSLKQTKFSPDHKDGLRLTIDQLKASPQTVIDDLILVKEANTVPEINGDTQPDRVLYTFLGDILQVAIDTATSSGSFLGAPQDVIENFKISLLDFRVGTKTYNLATLPIELGVFTEFLNNKIGKRNEYTKSFTSFARELIAEVLINRIDEFLNLKDGTTRSFKLGYASMNKNLRPANRRSYDLNNDRDVSLITSRKDSSGKIKPQDDFLVIYSDSPNPLDFEIKSDNYAEVKRANEQSGLHHFSLGTTSSIVKNISFDRLDLEYARERRLTMNQEDPYALLANVFNVSISMFGNNFFRPGSYIYVNPRILGDLGNPYDAGSVANIMGLGGYHIVTSVSHTINLNSFETTLDAVWETSGDGKSSFTGLKKKDVEGKGKKGGEK